MKFEKPLKFFTPFTLLVPLFLSPLAIAKPEPDACLELGALAWDNWTSVDAGGSGLPAGEDNIEYLRCKSCHGWDRLGQNGGYVRRPRNEDQPNTGYGDVDRSSRDIAPGLGDYYHVTAADILHEGRGRRYEEGSGSWSELDYYTATAQDKANYAAGYTLGNQHPDFSAAGVNSGDTLLTQDQVDCLVDFINFGDSDPRFYFTRVDTEANPVFYNIHDGARAGAGETFYNQTCRGCHGDPGSDGNNGRPEGGIAAFLQTDGAYSEFVHKARWGIPDSAMTRLMLGEPTSQNMIDVMLYLQEYVEGDNPFTITSGTSGTWYNEDRDGEGFVIDVFPRIDHWEIVATYYTYDGNGNQVWLIGAAETDGGNVLIPVEIAEGGIYGPLYDPNTVNKSNWGWLEFAFSDCVNGHVTGIPNEDMINAGRGFQVVDFDITRVTPASGCN